MCVISNVGEFGRICIQKILSVADVAWNLEPKDNMGSGC